MQNQYSQFLNTIKIENLIYSQGQWTFESNGEEGIIFCSKERLEILFNGSLRTAPFPQQGIQADNDVQRIGYTIAHCLRSNGLGYPQFTQAIVGRLIPQFKVYFNSKPKTNAAKGLVEYLQNFFAEQKDIGIKSLDKFQEIIDQYVLLSYGKVSKPYLVKCKNYHWQWVHIVPKEGEPSFCEWAPHSLYVYENEMTAQKSGPTLLRISPIL